MRVMADFAYMPPVLPAVDIYAAYLESPGAIHTASAEDWSRIRNTGKGYVPIFCAVTGGDSVSGAHYATEAINQSRNLGLTEGDVIVFNIEHAQAEQVVGSGQAAAFVGAIGIAGFTPVTYGSETDKDLLAPLGKLWGAAWGNPPELPPGYVMFQYEGGPGHEFDLSVVADDLQIAGLHHGGTPVPVNEPSPTVGFAPTHTGNGYWEITEDGHIYSFGDAPYLHSPDDPHFAHVPIRGIYGHPSDHGYWVFGVDGSVYAYGAARYFGTFVRGELKH